ncbi:hypothetical protein HK101_003174 [Irineochytrium annulatum]|nr:hypothetical protein HK101_003174 [Irineochytrium annulatum]
MRRHSDGGSKCQLSIRNYTVSKDLPEDEIACTFADRHEFGLGVNVIDDELDADLARAVALSLLEAQPNAQPQLKRRHSYSHHHQPSTPEALPPSLEIDDPPATSPEPISQVDRDKQFHASINARYGIGTSSPIRRGAPNEPASVEILSSPRAQQHAASTPHRAEEDDDDGAGGAASDSSPDLLQKKVKKKGPVDIGADSSPEILLLRGGTATGSSSRRAFEDIDEFSDSTGTTKSSAIRNSVAVANAIRTEEMFEECTTCGALFSAAEMIAHASSAHGGFKSGRAPTRPSCGAGSGSAFVIPDSDDMPPELPPGITFDEQLNMEEEEVLSPLEDFVNLRQLRESGGLGNFERYYRQFPTTKEVKSSGKGRRRRDEKDSSETEGEEEEETRRGGSRSKKGSGGGKGGYRKKFTRKRVRKH